MSIFTHQNQPQSLYFHIANLNTNQNAKSSQTDDLMKIYHDITFSDASTSDIKRENANIDGNSPMGAMLKYGSEGAKHFYTNYVIKDSFAQAHKNGDIHIHDLDFYSLTTTCCQIDLIRLFQNGFSTGHGVIREPNDIASYASLACIAIQSNQNDQHGGQSICNFERGLALGVQKTFRKRYLYNFLSFVELLEGETLSKQIESLLLDLKQQEIFPSIDGNDIYNEVEQNLLLPLLSAEVYKKIKSLCQKKSIEQTDKATYQAMESLLHNLNTMHSRAGAQTPFSSINYGTDSSTEGRMIIKNMLLVTEDGLGNGETAIFPIQIFRVKEGINYLPDDVNYDLFQLACRVSAKRLFPNFSFQDAPFNLEFYDENNPNTEISYMGCRTRVISNTHDPQKAITAGRGNLSFTSINLPRLALLSNQDVDAFFLALDEKIDLVAEQLLERFAIQSQKKVYHFPFLMGEGVWIDSEHLKKTDSIAEILKHGTLSIGFIGLAETLTALIGQHHGESKEAQTLGLQIISHMRSRLDEIAQKTQLNFSLIATPAEGLSGRFIAMDQTKFGIIPNITDKEYYTNSFHIPVHYKISAFEKIQLESPYHALTNAGHITYVELDGDPSHNLPAFEKLIRCMKESGIGYGSINFPLDRDSVCGYRGVIGECCPKCGRLEGDIPFQRIRRITGYLVGTLDRFNDAKRSEVENREKHCSVHSTSLNTSKPMKE